MNNKQIFFSLLGNSLNKVVYKTSLQNMKYAHDISIEDLKKANKKDFYDRCDPRLKAFIDSITDLLFYKKKIKNDNFNYKCNIFENILKARNNKFVSNVGLKV